MLAEVRAHSAAFALSPDPPGTDRAYNDDMTRVLAVDDEPGLLSVVVANLRAHGYEVESARTGELALDAAADRIPDAVILDLGLPGMSGYEVIQALRGWTDIPIIVLSARETTQDKVAALKAGADDYMTKPFAIDELLARVEALVRRASDVGYVIQTADFTVDFRNRRATNRDGAVHLTRTEWKLAEALVRGAGRPLTSTELVDGVWGSRGNPRSSSLRIHIGHLRAKLEPTPARPRYFLTELGGGYRFDRSAT